MACCMCVSPTALPINYHPDEDPSILFMVVYSVPIAVKEINIPMCTIQGNPNSEHLLL